MKLIKMGTNANIIIGTFFATKKTYRSKDATHFFVFNFVNRSGHIDIFCKRHPGFNGQSSSPEKCHLFHSGKLCFISGKAPTSQWRAEELAAQWAEYFLEYRRTGKVQE